MEPWRVLDLAPPDEARAHLTRCCGATRWVERMLARRPFGSQDTLLATAREEWFALGADDWLEAFSHHPRIGDREALRRRFSHSGDLSEREQSGITGAARDVVDALAQGNEEYLRKFGFIFIVCATGRTAREMLDLLHARLPNPRDVELRIAAEEQAKITELRLRAI